MRSVADEFREEQLREVLAMTPAERIELALKLGRRDVELYMAANGVDRETAIAVFRRSNRLGRRPSRCHDEP